MAHGIRLLPYQQPLSPTGTVLTAGVLDGDKVRKPGGQTILANLFGLEGSSGQKFETLSPERKK